MADVEIEPRRDEDERLDTAGDEHDEVGHDPDHGCLQLGRATIPVFHVDEPLGHPLDLNTRTS
jgi:hypothetical protein